MNSRQQQQQHNNNNTKEIPRRLRASTSAALKMIALKPKKVLETNVFKALIFLQYNRSDKNFELFLS